MVVNVVQTQHVNHNFVIPLGCVNLIVVLTLPMIIIVSVLLIMSVHQDFVKMVFVLQLALPSKHMEVIQMVVTVL